MAIVKIPIGPQHPALKEPESFLISLDGERIQEVGMRLGYNHRGIEKAAEGRTYIQNIYLLERVCGICSHSHSTAFIQAVEEVAGIELSRRAKYIRTIMGELERIHSHLLWLGVAGHEVGFDTLLMYSWRDREIVMDLLAMISGNRVNYGMNTFGGVRRDIDKQKQQDILTAVDALEERTKYYAKVATEEITLIKRLSGVGYISKEDVYRLGTVGPTGRASGMPRDTRKDDPYAAYDEVDFNVITDNHCDVYGRTLVRVGELMETYKIIRQLIKNMPDGEIAVKFPRRVPAGEATSRYEAPRGEDVHYVKGNGTDKPERVKLRAPTLANLQSVSKMLEDNNLADVPITIAAIDPCFSCTDRMIRIVDNSKGSANTTDWETLRKKGIEWYRNEKGIDFTDLNKKYANIRKVD
ncbi:MAG: nickel-dependent hydrogenase large subunit [bacterium]